MTITYLKRDDQFLLVCVLIITAENYLSPSTKNVEFGGLVLAITKCQLVSGFYLGLLYLWFVMIAKILTGKKFKEEYVYYFCQNLYVSYCKYKDRKATEKATLAQMNRLGNIRQKLENVIKSYSIFVSTAPVIILTFFVWIKYNGFFRTFSAIYEFIFS